MEGQIFRWQGRDKIPRSTEGRHGVLEIMPLTPSECKTEYSFPMENFKGEQKLSKSGMLERGFGPPAVWFRSRFDGQKTQWTVRRTAAARRHRPCPGKMPHVLPADRASLQPDARLRLQTREEIRKIQREQRRSPLFSSPTIRRKPWVFPWRDRCHEAGVVQQIGKPQEVWRSGKSFCGKIPGPLPSTYSMGRYKTAGLLSEAAVLLPVSGIPDQRYGQAMSRKASFQDDAFCCSQTVGGDGDISIVSTHPDCENTLIRAYLRGSWKRVNTSFETVRFALCSSKVFSLTK